MLINYKFKQKNFQFSKINQKSESNVFTVIVGKNGTGKSRLMQSIIESFIGKTARNGVVAPRPKNINNLFAETMSDELEIDRLPEKIIAVSTSPFDKFPLDLYGRLHAKYTYLGLRNLRAVDLGTAYMTNIYISLLKSVTNDPGRASKICEVLGFLGYSPLIEARYHLEIPIRRIQDTLNSADPEVSPRNC